MFYIMKSNTIVLTKGKKPMKPSSKKPKASCGKSKGCWTKGNLPIC